MEKLLAAGSVHRSARTMRPDAPSRTRSTGSHAGSAKSGTDASANAVTTRTRGRRGYTLNEAASAANGRVIAVRIKNT